MSDLYGVPQGGLMGMFANPQTAGLLGMAGGLLAASGPSRMPVSMGQALGMGLQGMEQGSANALNTQRQMMQMQAMQGLMGMGQGASGSSSAGAAPSSPSYSTMFGTSTPTAAQMPMAPSAAPAASAQPGPSIFGRSPQQLWNQGMMMNMAGIQGGTELMSEAVKYDPSLAMQMPTDVQKNAAAAYGYGTPEYSNALRGIVDKDAIVALRPGAPYIRNGQVFGTPPSAPEGFMNQPNSGGTWSVVPVAGGPAAVRESAAAQSGGKAQYQLQQVWDRTANNGQGGFVQQTTANVADAANGGSVPVGIRNNNFGNIKGQNGQFATYDTPQDGVNAADQLLATYGAKHGINTIAGIANRWAPAGDGNNNPAAKAAAMAAASGVGVNQPLNLADPATRARILPALFDTETPGWRGAIGGTPAASQRSGPMASQPPLGATTAANASQGAPSKQMEASQDALSSQDASYQQSRGALLKMLSIAQNGGLGDTMARMLPTDVATRLSNDAAEYQKAHANYVSLQGKALGSGGTDASRAMLDEAVPTFDKPQDAKISGLTDQLNQLDLAHLKRQTLSPVYQQGAEKAYTDLSAQFDKTVTPQMMPKLMPIMSMPASPARSQALQQAIQDPQMKAALDLMVRTGQLK